MSRGPWDLSRWACHIPVRLSRGLATLRVPFPFPLAAGICRTACATSLSARRVGPCKLFEAHGLTAFRLFPASYHYESLSGISSRQRRSDIPPRLRRGVTKHDYQESRGWRPLFRLCPTPSESELSEGLPRNEISIAYAMLTP